METPPLARKLEQSGVKLEQPRWYNFAVESYRPASPEEVERRLRDGAPVRARVPGVEVPLPVRSPQDLAELAHFQTGEPVELEQPQVAENLQSLARSGWQFSDSEGHEIGLYGAYNAATEADFSLKIQARKGERSIPVDSVERANTMAAFYVLNPGEEARCEEQGYRFFNDQGVVEPAYLLRDGGQVGKEEPWVARGEELTKRLRAFEELTARLQGDVSLARAVDRFEQLDLASARRLLDEQKEKRDKLAPVLVEALKDRPDELMQLSGTIPGAVLGALTSPAARGFARWGGDPALALKAVATNPEASGVELCKLATEGIPWTDQAAHERHLAEFAGLPETAVLAGAAQRVCAASTTPETRWAAWKAFAQAPEGRDTLAYGQRLYALLETLPEKKRPDQEQLGKALLAELPPSPLGELAGARNYDLEARGRLERPEARTPEELGALAADSIAYTNQAAHRQVLERLATFPEARFKAELAGRLHEQVQDPITRWAVWKACALHPRGQGAEAVTELGEEARTLLQGQSYAGREADQKILTRALSRELAALGPGRSALEAQVRWGVAETDLAAQGLTEHASGSLGELAVNSISWTDAKAQRKALAELGTPAALRVFDAVQTDALHWATYKAGVLHPKADARTLGREIYALLDSVPTVEIPGKEADLARLGAALVEEMRDTPQGQAAASWGLSDTNLLARGLTAGTKSLGELAAESVPWTDAEAHGRVLRSFRTDHPVEAERAERVHDGLRSDLFRWAVWKSFMLNPTGDAASLLSDSVKLIDGVATVEVPDKPGEWKRLCQALGDDLPAAAALTRWGIQNGELAARGLAQHPTASTPTELGTLAAESISWTDQDAHRKVLAEFADSKKTRDLAMVAARVHDRVTAPETRWAVWKACVIAPENPSLSAYRQRIEQLLDTIPHYTGREADLGVMLAEAEVRGLAEGMQASSDGIAVESDRVLVGGVVLRNKRGADPPRS